MLKYQFLSRRGLSDYEIFEKCKDFTLPKNEKKIGNKNLEELREKNKGRNMEIANSRSVDILWSVPEKSDLGDILNKIRAPK